MKLLKNVFYLFFPLFVGVIVSLVTRPGADYQILNKPLLSPPSIVFPIVWTILFLLMGVSYFLYRNNSDFDISIDVIYYLQLFVNALWSVIFFTFRLRFFAIVWILFLTILVYTLIGLFLKKCKLCGYLQVPYLVWCVFATYLTVGVFLLNW